MLKAVNVTEVKLGLFARLRLASVRFNAGSDTDVSAANPLAMNDVPPPNARINVGNEMLATLGDVNWLQQLIVALNAEQLVPLHDLIL